MKISRERKEEILKKRDILESAKKKLKKEFVGLDEIIDEIVDNIESWYLLPEGQTRPTIVNLWGLTGVGKTSLIQRLFHHIKMSESIFKFNTGDFAQENEMKLGSTFNDKLHVRNGDQVAFVFDEFQLGRTINEKGEEHQKTSGLRIVWDLLDSGTTEIEKYHWDARRVLDFLTNLEDAMSTGMRIRQGKVITNKDEFRDLFLKDAVNQTDMFVIPKELRYSFCTVFINDFKDSGELLEKIGKMGTNDFMSFMSQKRKELSAPVKYNFKQSCIFVIGNLDEAYRMTKTVSPDVSADDFHENSKKITITQIKDCLKERFRVEQIARLGNNHVIYPAFDSKTYYQLIKLELNKIKTRIKKEFGIGIKFDKSANEVIYREGVFPTHGTRPVFTTIRTQIDSTLSKVFKDIMIEFENADKIKWAFDFEGDGHHLISFYEGSELINTKKYPAKLKLEGLRKPTKDEEQLSVAVHESGHAIASIVLNKTIPKLVVSKTADLSEGFCQSQWPDFRLRKLMEDSITVALAGLAAEKYVFGDDFMSVGGGSDLRSATQVALDVYQSYGWINPANIGIEDGMEKHWTMNLYRESEAMAMDLLKECEKKATQIIDNNKLLFFKMSEYLGENSSMDEALIGKFIETYGENLELNEMEDYYGLKDKFKNKMHQSLRLSPKKSEKIW
jgi:cell division protease FtsH